MAATEVVDRLCMGGGDSCTAGSRVLMARCGPSGDVGPLRLDWATVGVAAAVSRSCSTCIDRSLGGTLSISPLLRTSLALMLRDGGEHSLALGLPERSATLLSMKGGPLGTFVF